MLPPLNSVRLRRFLAARFDRKSQFGIGLTLSALTLALAIWALSGLLDAILDNDLLVRWDSSVETWFHAHATPRGLTIFDAITQLGAPGVAVAAMVVAIYLWRVRASLLLWTWLGANVGGVTIEYVLKRTVHRSRPQYAAAYLHGHSYSFPSGAHDGIDDLLRNARVSGLDGSTGIPPCSAGCVGGQLRPPCRDRVQPPVSRRSLPQRRPRRADGRPGVARGLWYDAAPPRGAEGLGVWRLGTRSNRARRQGRLTTR